MRHNNWYDDPSGSSEVSLGFGVYDRQNQEVQWYRPQVQILSPHSYKEELQKPKLCSKCSKPISYIPQSQKWICYTCQITWIKGFDTPLTSDNTSIKPIQSTDSEYAPAFISAKKDIRLIGERKYANGIQDIQISGNGRIVKIKTTNLAKAMDEKWIQEQLQGDTVYGY